MSEDQGSLSDLEKPMIALGATVRALEQLAATANPKDPAAPDDVLWFLAHHLEYIREDLYAKYEVVLKAFRPSSKNGPTLVS